MSKPLIFQQSFLVSGIMCFDSCGSTVHELLEEALTECIQNKMLPSDARLIIDPEPAGLGMHQLMISIESDMNEFALTKDFDIVFSARIKNKIKEGVIYSVIDEQASNEEASSFQGNWINILVNLISIISVLILTIIFPPSILLTIGLCTITVLSTAFTARDYLFAFFQNFRTNHFANMPTTISLGWFLSMAHTLFHTVSMPLAISTSMIFMNFIMPMILITCINSMDEVKRLLIEKSQNNRLKGIKKLFPQMSETYCCHKLPQYELEYLANILAPMTQSIGVLLRSKNTPESHLSIKIEDEQHLHEMLHSANTTEEKRNLLRTGAIIDVNVGECFPVDCILIKGNTIIDASIMTGEPHKLRKLWQVIPAGAINLGHKVTVYAARSTYNSTVNRLLFRSNRAKRASLIKDDIPTFAYLYAVLIVTGLLVAILVPIGLGVATIPLLMQNMMGILFSVCPCTVAIAYQLPQLISLYHRSHRGIQLCDDSLSEPQADDMHTVVFDKTGTLTTGNSMVESSSHHFDCSLWQRIYLLEKAYGSGHPLAKAIQAHYESTVLKEALAHLKHTQDHDSIIINNQPLFDEINHCSMDSQGRGLCAHVQGRKIQIGNFDYLRNSGIILPEPEKEKIEQGLSAVCVAEDNIYKGTIYVKHEIRSGVIEALSRLKKEGKKIILLTGDKLLSARGLNKRMNSVFDEADIYADQTPQDKETFLAGLLKVKPQGVWFVGDGLNDTLCSRLVSENGGISCAMDKADKSAFFTDITLNGSLDYIFEHNQLNHTLQQNVIQNKGILIFSTLAFFAFIIGFSIAGIAVSPLISMVIMLSTTLFIVFNSYRAQLSVDLALDKKNSWSKAWLSSDLSIGTLLAASTLLISSVLVATIASGGLALPMMAFSEGMAMAFSSLCTLSAMALLIVFTGILSISTWIEPCFQNEVDNTCHHPLAVPQSVDMASNDADDLRHSDAFFLNRTYKPKDSVINNTAEKKEGDLFGGVISALVRL